MRDLEIEIVELWFMENQGCFKDLKSKKSILADLLGSKAPGLWSRFQSTAHMDSPSKFLFSLDQWASTRVFQNFWNKLREDVLEEL